MQSQTELDELYKIDMYFYLNMRGSECDSSLYSQAREDDVCLKFLIRFVTKETLLEMTAIVLFSMLCSVRDCLFVTFGEYENSAYSWICIRASDSC